jgi:hypothetical protein
MSKHATVEEKLKHKYYCSLCDSISFSPMFYRQHIDSLAHQQRSVINNHSTNTNNIEAPNNNLDVGNNNNSEIVNNEMYTKIRAEVKKEIFDEIQNKLLELFAQIN